MEKKSDKEEQVLTTTESFQGYAPLVPGRNAVPVQSMDSADHNIVHSMDGASNRCSCGQTDCKVLNNSGNDEKSTSNIFCNTTESCMQKMFVFTSEHGLSIESKGHEGSPNLATTIKPPCATVSNPGAPCPSPKTPLKQLITGDFLSKCDSAASGCVSANTQSSGDLVADEEKNSSASDSIQESSLQSDVFIVDISATRSERVSLCSKSGVTTQSSEAPPDDDLAGHSSGDAKTSDASAPESRSLGSYEINLVQTETKLNIESAVDSVLTVSGDHYHSTASIAAVKPACSSQCNKHDKDIAGFCSNKDCVFLATGCKIPRKDGNNKEMSEAPNASEFTSGRASEISGIEKTAQRPENGQNFSNIARCNSDDSTVSSTNVGATEPILTPHEKCTVLDDRSSAKDTSGSKCLPLELPISNQTATVDHPVFDNPNEVFEHELSKPVTSAGASNCLALVGKCSFDGENTDSVKSCLLGKNYNQTRESKTQSCVEANVGGVTSQLHSLETVVSQILVPKLRPSDLSQTKAPSLAVNTKAKTLMPHPEATSLSEASSEATASSVTLAGSRETPTSNSPETTSSSKTKKSGPTSWIIVNLPKQRPQANAPSETTPETPTAHSDSASSLSETTALKPTSDANTKVSVASEAPGASDIATSSLVPVVSSEADHVENEPAEPISALSQTETIKAGSLKLSYGDTVWKRKDLKPSDSDHASREPTVLHEVAAKNEKNHQSPPKKSASSAEASDCREKISLKSFSSKKETRGKILGNLSLSGSHDGNNEETSCKKKFAECSVEKACKSTAEDSCISGTNVMKPTQKDSCAINCCEISTKKEKSKKDISTNSTLVTNVLSFSEINTTNLDSEKNETLIKSAPRGRSLMKAKWREEVKQYNTNSNDIVLIDDSDDEVMFVSETKPSSKVRVHETMSKINDRNRARTASQRYPSTSARRKGMMPVKKVKSCSLDDGAAVRKESPPASKKKEPGCKASSKSLKHKAAVKSPLPVASPKLKFPTRVGIVTSSMLLTVLEDVEPSEKRQATRTDKKRDRNQAPSLPSQNSEGDMISASQSVSTPSSTPSVGESKFDNHVSEEKTKGMSGVPNNIVDAKVVTASAKLKSKRKSFPTKCDFSSKRSRIFLTRKQIRKLRPNILKPILLKDDSEEDNKPSPVSNNVEDKARCDISLTKTPIKKDEIGAQTPEKGSKDTSNICSNHSISSDASPGKELSSENEAEDFLALDRRKTPIKTQKNASIFKYSQQKKKQDQSTSATARVLTLTEAKHTSPTSTVCLPFQNNSPQTHSVLNFTSSTEQNSVRIGSAAAKLLSLAKTHVSSQEPCVTPDSRHMEDTSKDSGANNLSDQANSVLKGNTSVVFGREELDRVSENATAADQCTTSDEEPLSNFCDRRKKEKHLSRSPAPISEVGSSSAQVFAESKEGQNNSTSKVVDANSESVEVGGKSDSTKSGDTDGIDCDVGDPDAESDSCQTSPLTQDFHRSRSLASLDGKSGTATRLVKVSPLSTTPSVVIKKLDSKNLAKRFNVSLSTESPRRCTRPSQKPTLAVRRKRARKLSHSDEDIASAVDIPDSPKSAPLSVGDQSESRETSAKTQGTILCVKNIEHTKLTSQDNKTVSTETSSSTQQTSSPLAPPTLMKQTFSDNQAQSVGTTSTSPEASSCTQALPSCEKETPSKDPVEAATPSSSQSEALSCSRRVSARRRQKSEKDHALSVEPSLNTSEMPLHTPVSPATKKQQSSTNTETISMAMSSTTDELSHTQKLPSKRKRTSLISRMVSVETSGAKTKANVIRKRAATSDQKLSVCKKRTRLLSESSEEDGAQDHNLKISTMRRSKLKENILTNMKAKLLLKQHTKPPTELNKDTVSTTLNTGKQFSLRTRIAKQSSLSILKSEGMSSSMSNQGVSSLDKEDDDNELIMTTQCGVSDVQKESSLTDNRLIMPRTEHNSTFRYVPKIEDIVTSFDPRVTTCCFCHLPANHLLGLGDLFGPYRPQADEVLARQDFANEHLKGSGNADHEMAHAATGSPQVTFDEDEGTCFVTARVEEDAITVGGSTVKDITDAVERSSHRLRTLSTIDHVLQDSGNVSWQNKQKRVENPSENPMLRIPGPKNECRIISMDKKHTSMPVTHSVKNGVLRPKNDVLPNINSIVFLEPQIELTHNTDNDGIISPSQTPMTTARRSSRTSTGSRRKSRKSSHSGSHLSQPVSPSPETQTEVMGDSTSVCISHKFNTSPLWTHGYCALWADGVYALRGQLYGLWDAARTSSQISCFLCNRSGATIVSFEDKMDYKTHGVPLKAFHYPCALTVKLKLNWENLTAKR